MQQPPGDNSRALRRQKFHPGAAGDRGSTPRRRGSAVYTRHSSSVRSARRAQALVRVADECDSEVRFVRGFLDTFNIPRRYDENQTECDTIKLDSSFNNYKASGDGCEQPLCALYVCQPLRHRRAGFCLAVLRLVAPRLVASRLSVPFLVARAV